MKIRIIAAVWMLLTAPLGRAQGGPVEKAIQQFEDGELTAARVTLEGLEEGATDYRVPGYRGRIALAEKDLDTAVAELRRAVEMQPGDSMLRTWLGRAYIEKLQTVSFFEKGVLAGRAMEALEKAVQLDPANVEARVSLAGYYLNAPAIAGGSTRKAREQARAIVRIDPSRGHGILAGIHIEDEQYDLAFASLKRCIDAEPENLECRYRQAMLHQKLERYHEAFAAFEAILEIEPEALGALYQLARTAVFSGQRLDRGINCLEKYLTLEIPAGYPGPGAAHWRLGMLFERRGDRLRAESEYRTAISLEPDQDSYRESLKALGAG